MTPHFNLTKANPETDKVEYLLERSRIHFRTGKYLLKTGRIIHGYATLFDSLISGFEYYIIKNKDSLDNTEGFDINDYTGMFLLLNKHNILDFNFLYFDKLLSFALESNLNSLDSFTIIQEFKDLLSALSICPFDESLLPPIQKELMFTEKNDQ